MVKQTQTNVTMIKLSVAKLNNMTINFNILKYNYMS